MRWKERRERFREAIAQKGCVYPASVFDPISARIAEGLGFETGIYAGSVASYTVLGSPDITLITLTEFAEQCLRMARASALPLLADADHGYGNALNVMRTVEELEISGIAALTIEDTILPKAFGQTSGALLSKEESVGKMRAAISARSDSTMMVVARTNCALTTLEECVDRVSAYQNTGVDALFLAGVKTREELNAITDIAKVPVMLGLMTEALDDPEYLTERGIRLALQGHLPFAAAMQAVHDTMAALRGGTKPSDIKGTMSRSALSKLTQEDDYADAQKHFLQ